MKNKIILITGATGGIGRQTALSLAKLGYHVIITGRNKENGESALSEIKKKSFNTNVDLLLADISTKDGITALAQQFKQKYNRLDVLINNAGLAAPERQLTQDGIESNFAVNVLAPFLLTRLLIDSLRKSTSARVVTLSGGDHPSEIELDNLQAEKHFNGLNSYSHSKLIIMALMYEYSRLNTDKSVAINVCYPGQASTRMTQSITADMLPGFLKIIWPIFKLAVRPDDGKSAQKASRSSVYLATSTEVEGISGKYFNKKCRETVWPSAVLDDKTRQTIWELADRLAATRVK